MATYSKADAQEELAYIGDVMTGRASLDAFNGDWACFARYCDMQAATAKRAGFSDIADVMTAYRNRARRKDGNWGAAVLRAGAL